MAGQGPAESDTHQGNWYVLASDGFAQTGGPADAGARSDLGSSRLIFVGV